MGQFAINIHGTGVHHNTSVNLAEDADRMAAEFVEKLRAAGHTITHATITTGYENTITDGQVYLDERTALAKR